MGKTRAVIYISEAGRQDVESRRCLNHVEACGYDLIGVIVDHDGARWRDAFTFLGNGLADVVVVHDRGRLDGDGLPRLEVAGEHRDRSQAAQRRPRRTPGTRSPGARARTVGRGNSSV